ncbi:MAG: hypothetical protein QOF45_1894 [Gaiellaceae bacterium]|nr:hypothetical protein [Gaiellaceae bacterium]
MGYGSPRRLRHLTLVAAIAFCAPVPAAQAGDQPPAQVSVAAPVVVTPVAAAYAAATVVATADALESSPPPQPSVAPPAVAAPTVPEPNKLTHPIESIGSLSPPPVALETRTGGAATAETPARAAAKPREAPVRRVSEKPTRPGNRGAQPTVAGQEATSLRGRLAEPLRSMTPGAAAEASPAVRERQGASRAPAPAPPTRLTDESPLGAANPTASPLLLVAAALLLLSPVPARLPGRLVPSGAMRRDLGLTRPLERPG